jgi:hypothetical protein
VTRRRAAMFAALVMTAQSCALAWTADADAARRRQSVKVTLETTPRVAGVRVIQGRRTFTTDRNGRVRMSVRPYPAGRRSPEGLPFATPKVLSKTVRPGVVASFSRFGWDVSPRRIQVGLSLAYRVRMRFADARGDPIDPRRVQRVVVRNSLGGRAVGRGVDTFLLQGSRVGPSCRECRLHGRHGGLASKWIGYSVREVVIDGSNVVNRGEIRFYPFRTRVLPVELLFFDLEIASSDALLGTKIGSFLEVTGPDGRAMRRSLGTDGRIHLARLPRGVYRVRTDADGVGASRLVTLSRHQVVDVEVLSILDLLILGTAGSALAVALVLLRRPRLRARIARRVGRLITSISPISP